MKKKKGLTKYDVPEGFNVSMVLVDAIPVIFFGLNMIVISMLFSSSLFLAGGILCLLGGAGKVLWKLIVAVKRINIWPLFIQMRILMPAGFLLMIAALIVNHSRLSGAAMLQGFLSFPSVIFFLAGIGGMCLMMVFAFKLDNSDAKSNWIEQFTNGIAQAAIFVGLLLLL